MHKLFEEWKTENPSFEFVEELPIESSAWSGHYFFAYDLIANTKPELIVELGTHKGNSLFSFAQAIKDFNLDTELHAIDAWQGDEHSGYYGEEVYQTFLKIAGKYYGDIKLTPHRKFFDEAIDKFDDNSIDILHIDGLHTYEAVKHDFENWIPKVKQESGIIILHDVLEKTGDFGVYKLWEEIKKAYTTITFQHYHGLGVIFLGKKLPKDSPLPQILTKYYKKSSDIQYLKTPTNDQGANIENLKREAFESIEKGEKILSKNKELNKENSKLQHKILEFEGFQKGLIWRTLSIWREIKSSFVKPVLGKVKDLKQRPKRVLKKRVDKLTNTPTRRNLEERNFTPIGNIDTLKIFCSISSKDITEINKTLLPSILEQVDAPKIEIAFINYLADKKIKNEDFQNFKNIKIKVLNPTKKLGFGEAHNYAYKKENPRNCFLIINPDVSLDKKALHHMLKSLDRTVGLVEARQLPFSHPKDITKEKTFETNWASGCCLLINSHMFKEVGGFDKNYWMYLEDVDLSWRSWIAGYKVLQNPNAIAYHFTGLYFRYDGYSYNIEEFWSIRNFLYISYKFFGERELKKAFQTVRELPYKKELKEEAIKSFELLKKNGSIKQIEIPERLNSFIRVFGYNKFSDLPK